MVRKRSRSTSRKRPSYVKKRNPSKKRKTSKRKTSKRKTSKRKTSKRKTSKRKTSKRKTSKRKPSRRSPRTQTKTIYVYQVPPASPGRVVFTRRSPSPRYVPVPPPPPKGRVSCGAWGSEKFCKAPCVWDRDSRKCY